jgi:hypothetical protein
MCRQMHLTLSLVLPANSSIVAQFQQSAYLPIGRGNSILEGQVPGVVDALWCADGHLDGSVPAGKGHSAGECLFYKVCSLW